MEQTKPVAVGESASVYDSAIRRANIRIVPFLFVCFVLNYLDRINVGFGKLGFVKTLGFTDQVFGIGVSLFFIGFILFEILRATGSETTHRYATAVTHAIFLSTAPIGADLTVFDAYSLPTGTCCTPILLSK